MDKLFSSNNIKEILNKSVFSAYTNLVCVSLSKNINFVKNFNKLIDKLVNKNDVLVSSIGKNTITLILHERIINEVKRIFVKDIQDINDKVGVIFLKCIKEVNNIPGIITYISSLFSDKNVTIYEFISSYSDYIIVIPEKDTYVMADYMKKKFSKVEE